MLLAGAAPALSAPKPDEAGVVAALDRYAAAWASLDPAQLAEQWDEADASPLYLAEEVEATFTDWPAIRAYWTKNAAAFSAAELKFSDHHVKPLDASTALVAFHMRWRIAFKSPAVKPLAADNRVVALMRKKGKRWALAAWVEAPLAPTIFLRKELERNALEPVKD
jgi:hypothetical protein